MISNIAIGLLMLFSSMQADHIVNENVLCRDLVELRVESNSGFEFYRNKHEIPIVDKNGKMMFALNMEQKGDDLKLEILPSKECVFTPNSKVLLHFENKTSHVLYSDATLRTTHLEIDVTQVVADAMMQENIVAIQLKCMANDYMIVLKVNQGNAIQDILNCMRG